ncbi:hypothetical protein E2562_013382 [Oryza meyeriana var. granulata]|uniref:Uncharacterized protein n=1 Tax=Oryza meyeriana var. granulata TaxID=110450 RepID=A0A6G1CHT6_9ORYZ|nr:hypothetical protein E2562_013382 [Oryza meyeriana var. granulata]
MDKIDGGYGIAAMTTSTGLYYWRAHHLIKRQPIRLPSQNGTVRGLPWIPPPNPRSANYNPVNNVTQRDDDDADEQGVGDKGKIELSASSPATGENDDADGGLRSRQRQRRLQHGDPPWSVRGGALEPNGGDRELGSEEGTASPSG